MELTKKHLDIIENIQRTTIEVLGAFKTKNDIFRYLKCIIESVERENIKGEEKKQLAIRILYNIIDISEVDEVVKTYSLSLIDNDVISNFIDAIISAASGEFEVNMNLQTAETICEKFIIPCGISLSKANRVKKKN